MADDILRGASDINARVITGPQGPSGNIELAYAQITADVSSISSTTYVDVTGLSLSSLVQGTRPVMVEFFSPQVLNGTASQTVVVAITDGSNAVQIESGMFISVAFGAIPMTVKRRYSVGTLPSALKVRVKVSGGSGKIAATGVTGPAYLRVVEV